MNLSTTLNGRIKIRELSESEIRWHGNAKSRIFVRIALIIESRLNFFEQRDLINKSIAKWTQSNKLLRSRIDRDDKSRLWYVLLNKNEIINKAHFVDDAAPAPSLDSWFAFLERQLNDDPADHQTWELTLYRIDNNRIGIFFKIDHSICEIRCGHWILMHLFQIVEEQTLNLNLSQTKSELYASLDDLLDDLFVDMRSMSLPKLNPFPIETIGSYDALSSRFKWFKVDADSFKVIRSKCKSQNVKLTHYLNLICCWAFAEASTGDFDKINYFTTVNLRQYLLNNDDKSLGCYVSCLASCFDPSWLDDLNRFWIYARTQSESFHNRLRSGEQFKLDIENHVFGSQPTRNQMKYHFGTTNYGVLDVNHTVNDLVVVKQSNTLIKFPGNASQFNDFLFYNQIITIGNEIHWTISYDANRLSDELIQKLIQNINDLIRKV